MGQIEVITCVVQYKALEKKNRRVVIKYYYFPQPV